MAENVGDAATTKKCPRCAEEIQLEALFCRFCHQEFAVRRVGYCATCHKQVDVGSGTVCPTCGLEVIDVTTQSAPLPVASPPQQPGYPPAPPQGVFPPAPYPPAPYPPAPGGPAMYGAGAAAGPYMPPAAMPAYAPQTLIGMVIALCGSGLMIAGSFGPWLRRLASTVSGWDIFEATSGTGENPFFIWDMFSRFDPFVTGLTTVLIGALAGLLAVLILVAPKKAPPSRFYIPHGLHFLMIMILVVGMIALMATLVSAWGSNATRAGTHIESGLWTVVVGFIVTFVGLVIESQRPAVRQVPAPPSPGWPR